MISATKLSICTLAYLYTLWTATFFPLFLSHSWKATYMISWRHPWGDSERGWGRSWKPPLSQSTVQLPCVVPHIFLWTSFQIPEVITLPCLLEVGNSHMTFSVLRISVSVGGMCLRGRNILIAIGNFSELPTFTAAIVEACVDMERQSWAITGGQVSGESPELWTRF